jgi:hypothetical protein
VDVETHKILGFTATREDVSDAQTFPELLNQAQSKARGWKPFQGMETSDAKNCFNKYKERGVKPLFSGFGRMHLQSLEGAPQEQRWLGT